MVEETWRQQKPNLKNTERKDFLKWARAFLFQIAPSEPSRVIISLGRLTLRQFQKRKKNKGKDQGLELMWWLCPLQEETGTFIFDLENPILNPIFYAWWLIFSRKTQSPLFTPPKKKKKSPKPPFHHPEKSLLRTIALVQ